MTTLDDKLLGEKLHYYCSSSSSSENEDEEEVKEKIQKEIVQESCRNIREWDGSSKNTGPKGVIEDWHNFQKLGKEQRENEKKELLLNCKKKLLTCDSITENKNETDIETDKFLLEYREKRMQEMLLCYGQKNSCFGFVIDIKSADHFLRMIDEEQSSTIVIIHIYDIHNNACKKINSILDILANQYKRVKFCKVSTATAGLSLHFRIAGIPAFLIYKNKQIIGNFVRLTDEFGDDFCESDIENFLMEHDMLLNDDLLPLVKKQ